MDFESVVKAINNLLMEKRPCKFSSSWIRKYAPGIYRYIRKNIRTETGDIDWDRITRALEPEFSRKWLALSRKKMKSYRNKAEVRTILEIYQDKLYTFLSQKDKDDRYMLDTISIALVRIAQKGNMAARREIIRLISFTIEGWIESHPRISCWMGYNDLILKRIDGCIRCYRYSGSFVGYLFRTLEYAGRGMTGQQAGSGIQEADGSIPFSST